MTKKLINLPPSISKYLPYGILDMCNRSISDRDKFLSVINGTVVFFDRRSEIAPDGLRYNQTTSFSYQSSYAQLMYLIKIGHDSGCITDTEARAYIVKMNEIHYANLEFELINPAVDYTKLPKGKKSKAKSTSPKEQKEPKERKKREPKPEPEKSGMPKIKVDFTKIKLTI
jgi:hypothetical protein